MTLFFAALWARIWKYVAAFGALAGAVFALWLSGKHRGEVVATAKAKVQSAKVDAQVAEQITKTQESRNETDAKVNALPAAPVQTVATADPATAAGKLRDGGWVRPEDGS